MEEIMNYLIVKHLQDPNFECNPHIRVRSAYILAKKEYERMSDKEKEKLFNKIKNNYDDTL